jgi:hypothetical protein
VNALLLGLSLGYKSVSSPTLCTAPPQLLHVPAMLDIISGGKLWNPWIRRQTLLARRSCNTGHALHAPLPTCACCRTCYHLPRAWSRQLLRGIRAPPSRVHRRRAWKATASDPIPHRCRRLVARLHYTVGEASARANHGMRYSIMFVPAVSPISFCGLGHLGATCLPPRGNPQFSRCPCLVRCLGPPPGPGRDLRSIAFWIDHCSPKNSSPEYPSTSAPPCTVERTVTIVNQGNTTFLCSTITVALVGTGFWCSMSLVGGNRSTPARAPSWRDSVHGGSLDK